LHYCPTQLICLENTLDGTVFPQEEIIKISQNARKLGVHMHLEWARGYGPVDI
jgi:threonine aldolase